MGILNMQILALLYFYCMGNNAVSARNKKRQPLSMRLPLERLHYTQRLTG